MSSAIQRMDLSPAPGQCVRIRLGGFKTSDARGTHAGDVVLDVDPAKLADKARGALRSKAGYSRLANGGLVFRALTHSTLSVGDVKITMSDVEDGDA